MWRFSFLTHHFELQIMDLKFNMRSYMEKEPEMNSDIVLVALDDNSKISSGHPYLWPYEYYAETVKKITDGKPTSFAMDIILTKIINCTVDSMGWSSLVDELSESYMAINPYMVKFGDIKEPLEINAHRKFLNELTTLEQLPNAKKAGMQHVKNITYKTHSDIQDVSSGMGFANIEVDGDGVLRRLPIVAELNGMVVPHFFLKLLFEHIGYKISNIELASPYKLLLHKFPDGDDVKTLEIPLDGNGNMMINYMSFDKIQYQQKKGEFHYYSAWSLIQNRKALNFKEKTVLFGDQSLAARDSSPTPLDDGALDNPLIFCIAMSNILNESFIRPTGGLTTIYQILFLVTVMLICATRIKVFEFGLLSIGIMLIYICINFFLFISYGLQIQLLNVLIPFLTSASYLLIYSIYQSQVTMGVLEGSLQSYLSPHLMEKLKNNPEDMLKPGGERKRITVLFSDIAGFTSFTDQADPAEVQLVLEEYFSVMTTIVFDKQGIVDKYYGDGIMAFFENPEDGVTSAQAAVKSAVEMQKKAVELDKKYQVQNRFPFSIYVGIATGYAKVGNIGPPEKMDYTVIGSVANRAARLDSAGESGDILIDEDTYFFVKDDYDIEDFGTHSLKGFEKPVQIYRLE